MPYLQPLLFLLFLVVCWFGGQAVHELGHVLAAWCSGANVEAVYMLPISQTIVSNRQYGLLDCNSFFASWEKLFILRSKAIKLPILVGRFYQNFVC